MLLNQSRAEDIFRTLSNIYDRAFLQNKLTAFTRQLFPKNGSIVDDLQGVRYASGAVSYAGPVQCYQAKVCHCYICIFILSACQTRGVVTIIRRSTICPLGSVWNFIYNLGQNICRLFHFLALSLPQVKRNEIIFTRK